MENIFPVTKHSASKASAFTLIELLVVISIVALLSSVVLASLNSARMKAGAARAKADMATIAKAITVAQGEQNKTLPTITGSYWSAGPCYMTTYYDMTLSACYTTFLAALTAIQNATGGIYPNLSSLSRDPWGSPYLLNENQGEGGNCSLADTIASGGPDQKYGGSYNADDVYSPVAIPLAPKCP